MTFHLHTYEPYLMNAVGLYRKRLVPGNEIYVRGAIEVCKCQSVRLVPFDRRLRSVEVEIERRKA